MVAQGVGWWQLIGSGRWGWGLAGPNPALDPQSFPACRVPAEPSQTELPLLSSRLFPASRDIRGN